MGKEGVPICGGRVQKSQPASCWTRETQPSENDCFAEPLLGRMGGTREPLQRLLEL